MPSSNEFKNFVLDCLNGLPNIDCKRMMGEFLLYQSGVLFGGIFDNRLLIKPTPRNQKLGLLSEVPYPKAKPMLVVQNIDDCEYLNNLVVLTCKDLQKNKKT